MLRAQNTFKSARNNEASCSSNAALQRLLFSAHNSHELLQAAMRSESGSEAAPQGGGHLALGGPGVGRTTERIVPAIIRMAELGVFATLTTSLAHARNTRVHILHKYIPQSLFE